MTGLTNLCGRQLRPEQVLFFESMQSVGQFFSLRLCEHSQKAEKSSTGGDVIESGSKPLNPGQFVARRCIVRIDRSNLLQRLDDFSFALPSSSANTAPLVTV